MSERPCIAFQGVPGAYSHMACSAAHPEMDPVGHDTFAQAFASVEDGSCELGMIPIENTLGGRVADIHHLLPESNLSIIGEHFQPVRHQLLAPPGASLETLKTVASHEQGLAQCRDLIRELGVEPMDFGDTAGAAKEAAERNDPSFGAIASELAAETYGLQILRSRIEDKLGNTTRFVVMSRRAIEPDPRDGAAITSIVFQVRSVPGALYKALGGFATNGVNITKLESYMTDQSFTVAQFYAEFDGHPADPAVANAFEELQFFCSKMKKLGTYPRSPWRESR
ncbi:MAG: prephenate dehydratase [Acidimicrobiales bacterium]